MTMWLTESILANAEPAREQASRGAGVQGSIGETGNLGRGDEGAADLCDQLVDPDDLAQRFTRERIRGIGQTTRDFARNYKDLGKPWHEAGVPSAGNGTAMRAAPVGLVHLGDPYRIYQDSLLQSVVTHRDSMAIAAAACQAYAVARAATAAPGTLL
jgi:ADP-ribosylglycohydrolase